MSYIQDFMKLDENWTYTVEKSSSNKVKRQEHTHYNYNVLQSNRNTAILKYWVGLLNYVKHVAKQYYLVLAKVGR